MKHLFKLTAILAVFMACAVGAQAGNAPAPEVTDLRVVVQGHLLSVSGDVGAYKFDNAVKYLRITARYGSYSVAQNSYGSLSLARTMYWAIEIEDGELVEVTVEFINKGGKAVRSMTTQVTAERIPVP